MFRPNETVNDLVNGSRNFDFPLVFSQSGCLILNITVRQMFSKELPIIEEHAKGKRNMYFYAESLSMYVAVSL